MMSAQTISVVDDRVNVAGGDEALESPTTWFEVRDTTEDEFDQTALWQGSETALRSPALRARQEYPTDSVRATAG